MPTIRQQQIINNTGFQYLNSIFKLNLFNNFFNYSELLFDLKEKKIIIHIICKIKRIPNETE